MPEVWNAHFAFAKALTKRPIVLGEIGGMYIGQDKQWQDWALPYMQSQGFGLFYFALNPDSEDTGGLVPKDWSAPAPGSVEEAKLVALGKFPSTDVLQLCPSCANRTGAGGGPLATDGQGGGALAGVLPRNPIAAAFLVATVLVSRACYCALGMRTQSTPKAATRARLPTHIPVSYTHLTLPTICSV